MATRSSDGKLKGPIKNRVQAQNPRTKRWVKIDTTTSRIIGHKKSPGPYKSVRKSGTDD